MKTRDRKTTAVPINSKRVKYLIKLAGKTQIKLAEEIDYNKDTLNQALRSGEAIPRLIKSLAIALDADPRYIKGEMNYCLDTMDEDLKNGWLHHVKNGSVRLDQDNCIIVPYSFYSDEIAIKNEISITDQMINEYINSYRYPSEEDKELLRHMPELARIQIRDEIYLALHRAMDSVLYQLKYAKEKKTDQ
ncbi:MAG: helix-turn-helix transcriptional regulator [Solobacterium sp.]|nr:helix-turn-helix transcriptional regulator [Solobacterium sp.]